MTTAALEEPLAGAPQAPAAEEDGGGAIIRIELGTLNPSRAITNEQGIIVDRVRPGHPIVTYVDLPMGADQNGNEINSFPAQHNDSLFACAERDHDCIAHREIFSVLNQLEDGPAKVVARRALLRGHLSRVNGITHLPNHLAFVQLAHAQQGIWAMSAEVDDKPSFIHAYVKQGDQNTYGPVADELARFAAEYWDCPVGRPADLEDRYETRYGTNTYAPGSYPPPEADITMLHTTWGRVVQALGMFGFGEFSYNGTATATSATSLTGGTETGSPTHVAADAAGMVIVVTTAGTDLGKWAFITNNTSGTSPLYTVDQWYAANGIGSAATGTPASTVTYTILPVGCPSRYVALTTDSTAVSLGGTAGTQDAPLATTTLTSEILSGSNSGLVRKLTTITYGAGVVTHTTSFSSANNTSITVQKAADCCSAVSGGSGLTYMTNLPQPATLSATGDTLTTTWNFTET